MVCSLPARSSGLHTCVYLILGWLRGGACHLGGLVPLGVCACQDGGQVKSEPVNVHLCDPVPQAVHNEFAHDWVVAVESVTTATIVVVLPLRCKHVVNTIVKTPAANSQEQIKALPNVSDVQYTVINRCRWEKELEHLSFSRFPSMHSLDRIASGAQLVFAPERQCGALLIALCSVIEHNIHQHLYATLVTLFHHRLEFFDNITAAATFMRSLAVTCHRSKVPNG